MCTRYSQDWSETQMLVVKFSHYNGLYKFFFVHYGRYCSDHHQLPCDCRAARMIGSLVVLDVGVGLQVASSSTPEGIVGVIQTS